MDNTIHIAINPSETYILPTTVMLHSLGVNKGEDDIMIHAVSSQDLKSESKNIIREVVEKHGMSIEFLTYDLSKQANFDSINARRWTLNTFMKLYFSDIFKDLDKLLYLDGDMIIRHSLLDLWNMDVKGYPLIAVINGWSGTDHMYHDIHYDKADGYLNAGMVLFNLDWHREHNAIQEYNEYILNHAKQLTLLDQTVLANVMHDRMLLLKDVKYNCYCIDWIRKHNNYPSLTKEERNAAFHNPVILHFPYEIKPWEKYCYCPYANVWDHYQNGTIFKGVKEERKVGFKVKIYYYVTRLFKDFYYKCRWL